MAKRAKTKYLIGETFVNKAGQQYKIVDYPQNSMRRVVLFLDTCYEKEVDISQIIRGTVKDYTTSSLKCGAINDVQNGTSHFLYQRWRQMLLRCYDENHARYKTYGALGCTVCDEWFKFSNYLADIQSLENYEQMCASPKDWHIDKDIKYTGNKVYSKHTVLIVSLLENVLEEHSRRA